MSRLEEATRKLASAVERLERAAAAGPGEGEAALRDALAQAKQENTALRATTRELTGKLSNRLDGTIDRLKAILEA